MTRNQTFVIYQALINGLGRMLEKNQETGMTVGTINYPGTDFRAEIDFQYNEHWKVGLKVFVATEEGDAIIKEATTTILELPKKNVRDVAAKMMIGWGFDFDLTREISHRGVLEISSMFAALYNRVILQEEVCATVTSNIQMKTGSIEVHAEMKFTHPIVSHGVTLTLSSPDIPDSKVSLGLGGTRVNATGYRNDIIAELIERFEKQIAK